MPNRLFNGFSATRHKALFQINIIASACASLGLTGICCRRLRGSTPIGDVSHGLTPTAKCCRGFAALKEAG